MDPKTVPLNARLRSWASPVAAAVRRSPIGAAVVGVRLGFATPAGVQKRTDRYYSSTSGRAGIDYASDAHNRRGWFKWERELVESHFPPRGRVFVFAAGGGREMLELARLGCEVDGCECHAELVARGNAFLERHGVRAGIRQVPPDAAPLLEPHYQAVIVGWSSYGHIQHRAARIALLRALHAGCTDGAPLMLSFHARDGMRYPFEVVSRTANVIRRLRDGCRIETGDVFGSSFAHCFTREEIGAELREGGWELVRYGNGESGHAVARRGVSPPVGSAGDGDAVADDLRPADPWLGGASPFLGRPALLALKLIGLQSDACSTKDVDRRDDKK